MATKTTKKTAKKATTDLNPKNSGTVKGGWGMYY